MRDSFSFSPFSLVRDHRRIRDANSRRGWVKLRDRIACGMRRQYAVIFNETNLVPRAHSIHGSLNRYTELNLSRY